MPGTDGTSTAKNTGPTTAKIAIAAVLCALDEENDESIAVQLGISRRTLVRWKRRPEFIAARDAFAHRAIAKFERIRLDRWCESAQRIP